ncbi:Zinc carboxypeptidase [Fragilaria crotonensis]|nr:Zinc carboxypeptidase [Fragilaria crotonensis]
MALEQKGIDDNHRRWLARLLTTRRIVIIPTANALGYFQNTREEDGVDPNRDFPIDVQDKHLCMQTIAGRTINEVFREHMFQLALTFHGGTEVIGYEWGAPSFLHNWSPDDAAQAAVAHSYSKYGAGWPQSQPYDVGTMNDKVYYVRGGMEDWAYCGSWIPDLVIECEPLTYDEYPKAKTIYNNATLRAFNMLVETSHQKIPPTSMLGNSKDVLSKETDGNGHISRNIRLALLSADLVEPYVSIVAVNNLALSDDIVPLIERNCTTASKRPTKRADWRFRILLCKWAYPHPRVSNADVEPCLGPIFSAVVDVSSLRAGETLSIIASSRVDRSWAMRPNSDVKPDVPPQSHVVNARTNPDWNFESAGKRVKGRLDWFSIPVSIVVGDYDDNVGQNQAGREITTIEVSNRFGQTTGPGCLAVRAPKYSSFHLSFLAVGVVVCLLALALFVSFKCGPHEYRIRADTDEEDGSWSNEPYSDEPGHGDVEMKGCSDDPLSCSDNGSPRYTID